MKNLTILTLLLGANLAIAKGPCITINNYSNHNFIIERDPNWDDSSITIDGIAKEKTLVKQNQHIKVCSFNENFDKFGSGIGAQGLFLNNEQGEFRTAFIYGNYDINTGKVQDKVTISDIDGIDELHYRLQDQTAIFARVEIID